MIEDDVAIHLIAGIIDAGWGIIGEDAIEAANEVTGITVSSIGELVITGDCSKIVGDLCRAYEKVLRGKLIVDVEVRLNLKRGIGV